MANQIFLITGGAGFLGSHISIRLKESKSNIKVIAFDNLRRRGSELNLRRLRDHGVQFIHGDIRNKEDIEAIGKVNCIIECSADPSVLSGLGSSPEYIVNTNLFGTLNCLEIARKHESDFIFISTSRVYPVDLLNSIQYHETDSRFDIIEDQELPNISKEGITESFSLNGIRSLYGATKLCSELIIQEYLELYNIRGVINRCGLLTGPRQMAKIDQGVVALWVAKHIFNGELNYIGFEGSGKQVRDVLHVEDLLTLIDIELKNLDSVSGSIFNVGGGRENSLSLRELTDLCVASTGNSVQIGSIPKSRYADVRIYITNNDFVSRSLDWKPEIRCEKIIGDISEWINSNKEDLRPFFL